MPGPIRFDTYEEAITAPAQAEMSEACYGRTHDRCLVRRPPLQIQSGLNAGRWMEAWSCTCPCHAAAPRPRAPK